MANAVAEKINDEVINFDEMDIPRKKKKKKKKSSASVSSSSSSNNLVAGAIQKLQDIRNELNDMLIEREDVIDDLLRALVAGEHILLLGPPGTAKSLLANLFTEHIENANIFKWLMNRTTDPSDIAGPYSIPDMEKGIFKRITTGMSPEAHIVFWDEIFKSNEPALNFMLSMLNEGIFHNGGKAVPVELRVAIGASNEFPDVEDLSAFYDRFIFRHWVDYVQDPQNRVNMGRIARQLKNTNRKITKITLEEIDALREAVHDIKFPPMMEANYDKMYRTLQQEDIRISDRRYNKGQTVMMANALLAGRDTVNGDDFKALTYMLWNQDWKHEIPVIQNQLGKFVNPFESKVKELLNKAIEVKDNTIGIENRVQRAGEAVQANATLQDILDKMSKEIKEAQQQGVDTKPLETMVDKVEAAMEEIGVTCLRQSTRDSNRKW